MGVFLPGLATLCFADGHCSARGRLAGVATTPPTPPSLRPHAHGFLHELLPSDVNGRGGLGLEAEYKLHGGEVKPCESLVRGSGKVRSSPGSRDGGLPFDLADLPALGLITPPLPSAAASVLFCASLLCCLVCRLPDP